MGLADLPPGYDQAADQPFTGNIGPPSPPPATDPVYASQVAAAVAAVPPPDAPATSALLPGYSPPADQPYKLQLVAGASPPPASPGLQIGGGMSLPSGKELGPQGVAGATAPPMQQGLQIGGGMTLPGSQDAAVGNTQYAPKTFDATAPPAPEAPKQSALAKAGASGAAAYKPSKYDQAIQDDLHDREEIQAAGAHTQAVGENTQAELYGKRGELKTQQAAEARDDADNALKESKGGLEHLQRLSDTEANFRMDPNRYVNSMDTVHRGLYILAAGLSAASQGLLKDHGPNPVVEQMNRNINNDIAAQRQDYETAKAHGAEARNLYSMNLQATGSHDAAVSATRSMMLSAQAEDFEKELHKTGSQMAITNGGMLVNATQTQADLDARQAAQLAARANGAAAGEKFHPEIMSKIMELHPDASAKELNEFYHQAVPNTGKDTVASGDSRLNVKEKEKTDVDKKKASLQEALDHIDAISGIMEHPSFDARQTAAGESHTASAVNAMSRAETGGNRAPSEAEQKLIRDQLPHDPNSILSYENLSGGNKTRLAATRADLQQQLDRLNGVPEKKAAAGFVPSS